jgi:hypothetical protein
MKSLNRTFSRPESSDRIEDLAVDADAPWALPPRDLDGTLVLKALNREMTARINVSDHCRLVLKKMVRSLHRRALCTLQQQKKQIMV